LFEGEQNKGKNYNISWNYFVINKV
jgi:hypothetical protein